jgi:hypothetical protein
VGGREEKKRKNLVKTYFKHFISPLETLYACVISFSSDVVYVHCPVMI